MSDETTDGARAAGNDAAAADADAVSDAWRGILEERARALAQARVAPAEAPGLDTVRFRRGDAAFAVELAAVLGVFRPMHMIRLPHAPPPAAALTVWRGEILVVADVAAAGGMEMPHVIVLGARAPVVGIAADTVETIERIAPERIHAVPEGTVGMTPVRGVTDHVVSIIDVDALLRNFSGGSE